MDGQQDHEANTDAFGPSFATQPTQSPSTVTSEGANPNPWSGGALSPMQPDTAAAGAAPQPTVATDPNALNPRSCITCRRRKVRCDKHMPCTNCRRAQIPCVFPAPGRAPRRPRPKDPNAPPKNSSEREVELLKRLRKLEGIVEELSGQIDPDPTSARQHSASGESPETAEPARSGSVGNTSDHHSPSKGQTATSRDPVSPGIDNSRCKPEWQGSSGLHKSFGRLVLNNKGKSRYVSDGFWSKLTDELEKLRNETAKLSGDEDSDISDYEDSPDNSPEVAAAPSDHTAFIFGYSSSDVDLRPLHPLPSQIPFIWQVYQENVEPLIKMVHVPSMEKLLRGISRTMDSLSREHEALLFSMYYAAIVSLEDAEVSTNFNASKSHLLAQYRFALEQALAKADFLNTTELVVLQAFVLFLIVARTEDNTRFCWTLTGLAIRIAQSQGLHRDGSHFGLSPFDTEMRRRLWWNICHLDLRSAEEAGLELSIVEGSFDTELPTNINDADIDPSTSEYPTPRTGPTDCAVALTRGEVLRLSRRIHSMSSDLPVTKNPACNATTEERERMLSELQRSIEERFSRHILAENSTLFLTAAIVARIIISKISLVIYQPLLFPGAGQEISKPLRDRLFMSALAIIEYNHQLGTDDRCRQWRWLYRTYTQWQSFAFLLLEVCQRPWSPTVERAWQSLLDNYRAQHHVEPDKLQNHAAVFLPIKKLCTQATRHREAEKARFRADPQAARRCELGDGVTVSAARFGPLPGAEIRLAELHAQWRKEMMPNGIPPEMEHAEQPILAPAPMGATPAFAQSANLQAQPLPPQTIPDGFFPESLLGADPFSPLDLWSYAYQGPTGPEGVSSSSAPGTVPSAMGLPGASAAGQAMPHLNSPESFGGSTLYNQSPQGGAAQARQAVGMESQPSYMWSDPFTVMNTKFDDVPLGGYDMDMGDLGEDFNWQTWQARVRDVH